MPYVSADYGENRAEVLDVFQDPGSGTTDSHTPTGSGSDAFTLYPAYSVTLGADGKAR